MKNKTATIQVEEYVYEKVKKTDVVINIPQEPIYFQEFNHRAIIGLFPQFATWGDKSVWEIQVIEITDNTIEKTMVRTNNDELSDIISMFEYKNKTNEDYLKDKIVRYLKDYYTDDRVSKDVFVSKYKMFLHKISEVAGV